MAEMFTRVKKAPLSLVRNSTRAFVLLKPDTLHRNQIGEAIGMLSKRLDDDGVKHRVIAPMLANMSSRLIDALYQEHYEKDWFKQGFKPFMMGQHPDKRIPSCPVASFILEMKNIPGNDMFSILRSDNIIGPTDPFSCITKFPERAEQIKKSVRLNLVGNDKIKPWDNIDCPVMNRMHCSAGESDAEKELSTFYLSMYEFILPYYSNEAAHFLKMRLNSKGMEYELTDRDFRIPLLSDRSGYYSIFPSNNSIFDGINFFALLMQENAYRDFNDSAIYEMFNQIRDVLPNIEKAQNDFLSDQY